ncbi:helix-turn-helix transcriptional regulator [Listeria monocytogenes]|nr:helix-turn-helix transcriptional regulator [Listeria monocytogenes]
MTINELSDKSGIGYEHISRIRTKEYDNPSIKTVIALCIGMNLSPSLSKKFLNLAGYTLKQTKEHIFYGILLDGCSSFSIYDCNALLIENGFKPLTSEK